MCVKSTIGKRMAQYLDIEFVDADKEIEKAAGMSIEDIFDQFGEDATAFARASIRVEIRDTLRSIASILTRPFMGMRTRPQAELVKTIETDKGKASGQPRL